MLFLIINKSVKKLYLLVRGSCDARVGLTFYSVIINYFHFLCSDIKMNGGTQHTMSRNAEFGVLRVFKFFMFTLLCA